MRDATAGECSHHRLRFFSTSRAVGAIAIALFAAVTAYAALDTSGPMPSEPREWKDDRGQVIKHVDAEGRMTLLTWDAEGHLIKIAGLEGRVDLSRPDVTPLGREEWVHQFRYEDGKLASEIDCVGREHILGEGSVLDARKGTTLKDRKHVSNDLSTTEKANAPMMDFAYDEEGRLKFK